MVGVNENLLKEAIAERFLFLSIAHSVHAFFYYRNGAEPDELASSEAMQLHRLHTVFHSDIKIAPPY